MAVAPLEAGQGSGVSWDRVQREILDALGYTLWRRTGAEEGELPDSPLLDALLRAAGRGRESPDAATLWRSWPPLAQLRDPAAKRALWPRLRALRRQPPV